jgi:hypothetical protein
VMVFTLPGLTEFEARYVAGKLQDLGATASVGIRIEALGPILTVESGPPDIEHHVMKLAPQAVRIPR